LEDTSDQAPALASHNGLLFLAFKGSGNDNLNLRCSRDGSFAGGPWYFCDLSRFGLYVAVRRTPPARPEDLDTHLDSLGFLYAMEADLMSFDTFRQRTLARNPTLPARFDYGGKYVFHAADGESFAFWLSPSLEGYQVRISPGGVAQTLFNFMDLPLVEGVYMNVPGGHDGRIEIRQPACTTPLVLDFASRTNPLYLDNMWVCAQPWMDRAEALRIYANRLAVLGRQKEATVARVDRVRILQRLTDGDPGTYHSVLSGAIVDLLGQLRQLSTELLAANRPAEAADAIQAALDVLTAFTPAAGEDSEYRWELGLVLVDQFHNLLASQRPDDATAAAVQSIHAFTQAVASGGDAPSVAVQLRQLSTELLAANRPAEAADAIQAALDVLN
jgi:hypothetical protein